ncbi:hypothetical protein AN958_12050 [Leucoagaricus sp. SymC.cos]|nr:hypothetical protein AN958_12050 [Leucoagaricus sp. SymC.cos]
MNGSATWRDKVFQKLDPDTGDLLQFRMCSSCRRPSVPLGESKKTCSKCREKQKRQQAKAKLAAAELEGENTHSQFLKSGFPDRGLKRKPEKTLQGLEGEQPRRALKMMKHALNDAIRTPSVEPVRTTVHTEYQKASSLYDAVKLAASANIVCNFAGCHSIVRSNVIDNNKRTQLVAKDLRKIVRIPFKYDVPIVQSEDSVHDEFFESGFVQHTHPVAGILGQQIIVQIIH